MASSKPTLLVSRHYQQLNLNSPFISSHKNAQTGAVKAEVVAKYKTKTTKQEPPKRQSFLPYSHLPHFPLRTDSPTHSSE